MKNFLAHHLTLQYLAHADPDETYYVFCHTTYTVGSDPTVYDSWSPATEVNTYSLLSFNSVTPTNNSATINYSVTGTAATGEISYSVDNQNWTQLSISNWVGGSYTITGLTPSTTYYLRGRVQSTAGWQGYVTDRFTTTGTLPVVTVASVTDIKPTEAQVNLDIQ